MKKNEIKGLSAFEMLDGLDDGMILSASLPEAVPASVPTAGERIAAFFGRMGKSGIAAAIATVLVALAVLIGVMATGRMGIGDPVGSDPLQGSHGVQGTYPEQSGDTTDTNGGVVIPPLTESPAQGWGDVSVTSDGMMVYPRRYQVAGNCYRITEEGEQLVWSEEGEWYRLEEIYKTLPVLTTVGNRFSADVPEGYVMDLVVVYDSTFQKLSEHNSIEALSQLTDGTYYVVQSAHEIKWNNETEYEVASYEYVFRLTVDGSMDASSPVRIINGDMTYYLTGYCLHRSYYDAELGKEIVTNYDGATYQLQALMANMVTTTVFRHDSISPERALSLYLAPIYDLKEITVYTPELDLVESATSTEPLEILHTWHPGDYYVIITATYAGTGETEVVEFPIHVVLAEEDDETTYPNDVGETPDEPTDPLDRVLNKADPMTPQTPDGTPLPDGSVLVGQTALYMECYEDGAFLGQRVTRMAVYRDGKNPYIHHLYADVLTDEGRIMMSETQEIHGFFVLLEYDGTVLLATMEGDPSPDGLSCTVYGTIETQLSWTDADNMTAADLGDIRLQRVEYDHWVQAASMEKLEKTINKTMGRKWDQLSTVLQGEGGAEKFGVLMDFWTDTLSPHVYRHADSTSAEALEARDLILNTDQSNFDRIWEAFVARMNDRIEGILPPPLPETNPRVVVASRHGSAVFETEEDGFLAWREMDLSHTVGTPAADVIFAYEDNTSPLPALEMVYGDPLTLFLDAAGDEPVKVTVYDAKGGFIAEGGDLSVVDTLENEGWDRDVILVLQIISSVSEAERVCYEYAFELTIKQP